MKLKGNTVKEPELLNGRPIIYSMNDVRGFFEQVGRNTQYILHPEEIMADNFVYAINDRKKQPTQAIISSIQNRLKQK
jgi:predicted nucleic acid-binding Zn finger protein